VLRSHSVSLNPFENFLIRFTSTKQAIMANPGDDSSAEQFRHARDDVVDCRAAMNGEKLPSTLQSLPARLGVIYGMRHHDGFGSELYGLPDYPDFTRALNARSIMSNIIPDMVEPQEFPYCIWHPDIASEDTYRSLARRYPQIRYQVGRACAVAGYTDLYHELDLLPEVSIAEEARDSGVKGEAIFSSIMASPVKYAIMDDYTRSVSMESPRVPAFLNCDTAVWSSIDVPQKSSTELLAYLDVIGTVDKLYFDITECRGVCHYKLNSSVFDRQVENWYAEETSSESKTLASLLYSPLPTDLPNVNKDLLILVAAYSGNIDRYARLRRPTRLGNEIQCLVRGIYHDTMFAKWWSQQPEALNHPWLQSAINARFIMNNDLSRITDTTPDNHIPLLIHKPTLADRFTYEELARRKPFMAAHCARVCIIADYQDTYDRLKVKPEFALVQEARQCRNPYYLKDLMQRAAELHIDAEDIQEEDVLTYYAPQKISSQTTKLLTNISASDIIGEEDNPSAVSQAALRSHLFTASLLTRSTRS
jgi:hypothetical protein